MFWRGITGFAHIGARWLPKIVQRRGFLQFAAVLNRGARYFASEAIPNNEISTLRLWSDGGGEEVESNPFDDLGAWHDAEAKSFLSNVSVDTVGKSTTIGHRQVNEDSFKLVELQPDLHYYAVFDGHGGSVAVDFVSDHLHECITHFYSRDKNIESVLIDAFAKCNSDLEEYCKWLTAEGTVLINLACVLLFTSIMQLSLALKVCPRGISRIIDCLDCPLKDFHWLIILIHVNFVF